MNIIDKILRPYQKNFEVRRNSKFYELAKLYFRFFASEKDKEFTDSLPRIFANYYFHNNEYYALSSILDAFVYKNKLYIFTNRPGLIIGKGGKDMDNLQKFVTKYLDIIIEIILVEDLWSFYSKSKRCFG